MENYNEQPKEENKIEDLNQEENRENEDLIKINNGIEIDEIDSPEEPEQGKEDKA